MPKGQARPVRIASMHGDPFAGPQAGPAEVIVTA